MYATGSKKMLNMYILDILRERTDETRRLTQANIIDILRNEYGVECERKAVARNIAALMEYGCEIVNDGGYYLAGRDFEDSELRLLIDSVYFSPHIPTNQARALIEKLRGLAGPGFGRGLNHVVSLPALHNRDNKQFFYTLQTLDEAIGEKHKVSLMVNAYGIDKCLHPLREEKYIVNPYQLAAANGRYYLIGNHDRYDNIAHLRVDRISDCVMLEEKAKPMQLVKGLEGGIQLPEYMAEHIHMRIGEAQRVRFRVHQSDIGEVIDWFGTDIRIEPDEKPEHVTVTVRVNPNAMLHWTMQYLGMAEVLEPEGLREKLVLAVNGAR